jgi:hydroxyacylglutathione hydrolase
MTNDDASPGDLRVEQHPLGPYETNCYLVYDTSDAACWVIDPGFDAGPIIDVIRNRGLEPSRLILTHAHLDHIAGVDLVRDAFPGLRVAVHGDEQAFLGDPSLNLSVMTGIPVTARPAEDILTDGDELALGPHVFRVIHTPGHSPGGITLYQSEAGVAIVGDTLFDGSVGRMDFPTSNQSDLINSIRQRLYALPDETVVYPGHGPTTTIGKEKVLNAFVRA